MSTCNTTLRRNKLNQAYIENFSKYNNETGRTDLGLGRNEPNKVTRSFERLLTCVV